MRNPTLDIDFYKSGHKDQYPEGTEFIQSNLTPRSARLFKGSKFFDDKIVVFGIQHFIQEYLINTWDEFFFNVPWHVIEKEYQTVMDEALGPDMVGTDHIRELHDLMYLPIEIRALPEGSRAPMRVPVLTITNTDKRFFWLVNYLETVMSSELWQPMTNATVAFEYKRILTDAARRTGCPQEGVAIQAHDFSFRGMAGRHAAVRSGMAHLTSFIGTDCVAAIPEIKRYYAPAAGYEVPIGVSVPATEHSVMCLGGEEDEFETFRRLIEDKYPAGIVSIVSDTWDYWKVITEFLPALKDKIMNRERNALGLSKVVIRPDSGDPVKIICGDRFLSLGNDCDDLEDWKEQVADFMDDQFRENLEAEEPHFEEKELWKFNNKYFKVTYQPDMNRYDKQYYYVDNYGPLISKCTFEEFTPTAEQKGTIECMWETFGGTYTPTNHKLLDEHIGLIYGDSITLDRCQEICDRLAAKGFASQNVVFGVGSFTYQYNTRDTFGFAVKATWGVVNGEERDIFKSPKTDSGVKKSAKGYLSVVKTDGEYTLYEGRPMPGDELRQVFKNGAGQGDHEGIDIIRGRLEAELA